MRVVVVGNGLAGTIASKTLREIDKEADIEIFSEEKYLYYPRPNLIEFLAGNIPQENLFAFAKEWYEDNQISVHLSKTVEKLFPESKQIGLKGGRKESYDSLLLANGASSWMPPIKGKEKKGIFTLRTMEDADGLLDWVEDHPDVVIIGGGLLGLEIARAIRNRGASVHVVEFFPRLLPRQLDDEGASILCSKIEDMGIEVTLGTATEEILGDENVKGLKFKGGEELKAKTAVLAAGVRPNIRLASDAGIETDKGVVVDDLLRTSYPGVYAAGDNVQHRDKIYGIIPASFNQARTAAFNIAGDKKKYGGTIPSNTLKVVGVDLTSIGNVTPEEGTAVEFRKTVPEEGIYKKIVIQGEKLVGAIWMGTKQNINEINRIILQKNDVGKWEESLLEEDFDFSVI